MKFELEVSKNLWNDAEVIGRKSNRTPEDQIVLWMRVGKASLENPDLPASFIEASLLGMAEDRFGLEAFSPRGD